MTGRHDAHVHCRDRSDLRRIDAAGVEALIVTSYPSEAGCVMQWLHQSDDRPADAPSHRIGCGLHPQEAEQWSMAPVAETAAGPMPSVMLDYAATLPSCDAIGEVGLDGDARQGDGMLWRRQQEVFAAVLDSIPPCRRPLPVSIHSRGASRIVLDMLAARPDCGAIPILHWWAGSVAQTERATGLGCWYSVNASMLRQSEGAQRRMAAMPTNRILLETDAPFRGGEHYDGEVARTERGLASIYRPPLFDAPAMLAGNWRSLWATAGEDAV